MYTTNSQLQHFFLIFLKCLCLHWRQIYNWVKVWIWIFNRIVILFMLTILLLLKKNKVCVILSTSANSYHWASSKL